MGRKGPRAKTKTVLKSVSKMQQLDSMPNFKCQTFLNKNHPIKQRLLDFFFRAEIFNLECFVLKYSYYGV